MISTSIDFKKWIAEHRHLLKPPVGNQVVWQDTEFIIMVVGGPNARKDFHYNEGEEFYYQLEGSIVLKTIQDGKPVDVKIKQGEIFLLPPRTPHSPRRPAHTVGLVIERRRDEPENDGCIWFCEKCGNKLYEEFFHLTNIVTQLPPVFDRFYNDPNNCTCKNCGTKMERPVLPEIKPKSKPKLKSVKKRKKTGKKHSARKSKKR